MGTQGLVQNHSAACNTNGFPSSTRSSAAADGLVNSPQGKSALSKTLTPMTWLLE